MADDIIRVSITEDAIVKLDTDRISLPNHVTATNLVGAIARIAGGKTTRKAKTKHSHGHLGAHTHEGEHEHH